MDENLQRSTGYKINHNTQMPLKVLRQLPPYILLYHSHHYFCCYSLAILVENSTEVSFLITVSTKALPYSSADIDDDRPYLNIFLCPSSTFVTTVLAYLLELLLCDRFTDFTNLRPDSFSSVSISKSSSSSVKSICRKIELREQWPIKNCRTI